VEDQFNFNRSELGNLSIRDLFFKYIRFLPFFVLAIALMLFAAYGYLRYATRIYSSTGTLLINSDQQKGSNSDDKFASLFGDNKNMNIQNEMEVLRSKPLMERVVKKLGLEVSYFSVGKIRSENIYIQGPFSLQIYKLADSSSSFSIDVTFVNDHQFHVNNGDSTFSFGEQFQNRNGIFSLVRNPYGVVSHEYNITWQPASAIAASLVRSLQVVPKTQGAGIISITIQGTNPKMCADVVNQLMDEYRSKTIEDKNQTDEQTLQFINDRLDSLGHDLDSIQKIKLKYQLDHDVIDLQAQANDYFEKFGETDKDLTEQQFQMNVANYVDGYLRDKKNEFNKIVVPSSLAVNNPVPSSLGLNDPVLNGYIEAYNKAQIDRQSLLNSNIPPQNPSVKELTALIEKLRVNIVESLRNIKATINTAIGGLTQKKQAAESELRSLPLKSQEYLEILRLVESKQDLYKILQQKREETAISKASNVSNSQVIDKASVATTPIKPNKRAIQLFAILIGLAIPVLFIFLSEILNDKITTRYDIEKITATPILGEVGHSFAGNSLVVSKNTRSMVAEQFRIIRSNLQFVLGQTEKPVILVTSSFSGEGKSFVCTNLGAVMALTGKKTIILEFDIRKPKILSGLKMPKRAGITNFLVQKADINELITPVPGSDNLFVLGCGPVPPNPAELLLEPSVVEMFEYLKKNFDVVIVDTAPVGMVSDAMTLGKFADCTLYLVRQRHTFKKQIALIDDFHKENKLPKISIIINDVKLKPGYGYYGYGRYGYGYGYNYKSYYDEETPKEGAVGRLLGKIDITKKFRRSKDE
jgi:capsular exopolysaccharide synthesis family protein